MTTTDNINRINELLNELTAREDDSLWITFDRESGDPISLHIGAEPEFSNDADIIQVNLHSMSFVKEVGDQILMFFSEGGIS